MVAIAAERRAIRLFPRQQRFVDDQRKYPAAIGGIGSGKTMVGCAKVIARLNQKERGGIFAPTYDVLRMATLDTLFAMLADVGIHEDEHFVYNKNEKEITFTWGHRIVCRSAERYQNLRGPNLDYAYVDEGPLLPKDAWRIIKGRVRIGRNPQAWLTGTPKGRNWTWEEWERDAAGTELDPVHPLYRFATTENPTLPVDFVDELGYEGAFYEQEISGQFVNFEGLVYAGFQRQQVQDVACGDWPAALGLDFGFRSPTVLLTLRHFGGRFHIERELYRRTMTATEIKAAVHAEMDRTNASFVVADVNAGQITEELRREGVRVRDPQKAIKDGIAQVSGILPALTVDPACLNTIAEFESYQYPEGGTVEKDDPIKANDHAMDALRYLVMELTKPKRKVRVF